MRSLLLYSFLFLSIVANCQKLDSLWSVYKDKANDDTTQLNALHLIVKKMRFTNLDSAIIYAHIAVNEARSKLLKKQEGLSLILLGNLVRDRGMFQECINYQNKALEIVRELNLKKSTADCYSNIGLSYSYLSNFTKALNNYLQALKIRESIKDTSGVIISYVNIGNLYDTKKQFNQALNYYSQALKLNVKSNSSIFATIYSNLANVYYKQNKFKLALSYYTKALKIRIDQKNKKDIGLIYGNISLVYGKMNFFDTALVYNLKAISLKEWVDDKLGLTDCYINNAAIYIGLNDFKNAISYGLKGLDLSRNIVSIEREIIAHQSLAESYSLAENFKKAFIHQNRYIALKDSIYNIENSKQLADLRINFEVEKKEIEMQKKADERENKLIISGVSILFLVLLIATFAFFRNKQKKIIKEKDMVLLEQKLLRVQMNPHFIFNCLGSIQLFVTTNKPLLANQYIASLAVIMRRVLEDSMTEYVSLNVEIDLLKNYLQLNSMLLGEMLEYQILVNEIDTEKIKVPSMLVQPFVENAIIHGKPDDTSKKRNIVITYSLNQTTLCCTVDNNGVGISQNKPKKSNHKSLALQIVTERLALLQSIPKQKVNVSLTDLVDSQNNIIGTRAAIEIPFLYN